jgi:hypothetical protein
VLTYVDIPQNKTKGANYEEIHWDFLNP